MPLSPVTLPLPVALLALALLAYILRNWADNTPSAPAAPPRHRYTPEPARPRALDDFIAETEPVGVPVIRGLDAEETVVLPVVPDETFDFLDARIPLSEVETWLTGMGMPDWYRPAIAPELAAA